MKKQCVVDAVQIKSDTFDDTHPNKEHIRGVLYDPVSLTAKIKDMPVASIGDWIVINQDGSMCVFTNHQFLVTYEQIPNQGGAE